MRFDGFMPSATYGDIAQSRFTAPSSLAPSFPTDVACTVGALALAGLPAAVGAGLTVNANTGAMVMAGIPVSIIAVTSIPLTIGRMTLLGLPQNVNQFVPPMATITVRMSFSGSDALIPVYDIGDFLNVHAIFTDDATGLPVDLPGMSFRLRSPAGEIFLLTPTRSALGEFDMSLVATSSGVWRFTWSATGVSEDGEYIVSSSLADAG